MLKTRVQDAINEQINAEMYSSYLYLAMAAWADAEAWPGIAHWFRAQAGEENEHALKFYHYVTERGGRVFLKAIDCPPENWDSVLDAFKATLAHEIEVTRLINGLYEVALEEKDYATQSLLRWFIDEQVEEEASAQTIWDQLDKAGNKSHVILQLDRALAAR